MDTISMTDSTHPAKKRVYRCPKRVVKLITTNNDKLRVTLTQPTDEEECPITMSPMKEDALDFLPDQTFFPHLPHLRKTQLPCGHSFGTLNLLYYFSRNSSTCPSCRAGFASPLSTDCIPSHLVTEIARRVKEEKDKEREEQEEENHTAALSISLNFHERSLSDILDTYTYQLRLHRYNNEPIDPSMCLYTINIRPDMLQNGNFPGTVVFHSDDNLGIDARGFVAISVVAIRNRQQNNRNVLAQPDDQSQANREIRLCRTLPFNAELCPNAPNSAQGTWIKGIVTPNGPFTITYRSASHQARDAMIQSIRWGCQFPCLTPIIFGHHLLGGEHPGTTTMIMGVQIIH